MTRFLTAFLLLAAALLPAQQAGLYVRYSQWSTDIEGEVDAGGLWDLTEDLALENDSPRGYGFVYRGVKHRFSAEVFESSFRETVVAGEGMVIGGEPVEPGTEIDTGMDWETIGVEYWYHLVSAPSLRTGLIVGGEVIDVSTRIQDTHYSHDDIVPYIGLGLTALTPRQGIYVDLAITLGDNQGSTQLSGRIEAGLDLMSGFGVYAGLRKVDVETEGDGASWDFDSSSYYFGAHLHL